MTVKNQPKTDAKSDDVQVIDTSGMSKQKAQTMEMVESAREGRWQGATFAKDIFMGDLKFNNIFPYPAQPKEDQIAGQPFLDAFKQLLKDKVDADKIDRDGEIPKEVLNEIAELGAFGIKIDKKYGGLGLSQTNYLRAGQLMGSTCANITALVSAHQSIGVPQPLILFGTPEQKEKYLTRCAKGEISAFALTETDVGSDPAKVSVKAELSDDKSHYIVNGEKLWCTNGTVASFIIAMVRTEDKMVNGKPRRQVSAFIIDMDTPGVTVTHRCRFMGLKSLYNAVIKFEKVKVPVENVIDKEGRGLKVALETLNTGRLTMAGSCTGAAKVALDITKKWSNDRSQWGCNIGKHSAIADKITRMAARIFSMEAISLLTAQMVDLKKDDIRLESAMSKMKCTEDCSDIINETLQIRGGRGFETAQSLAARGEEPVAIERMYRDCRINTIFEGSSEIMRLIIAREALDSHLMVAANMMNKKLPFGKRVSSFFKAMGFYLKWYPSRYFPVSVASKNQLHPTLAKQVKRAAKQSRKLSRKLFHTMAKFGPKLEMEHIMLKRFVDIGTELFSISATCSYAQLKYNETSNNEYIELANIYCNDTFITIQDYFHGISKNNDRKNYKLAQRILSDEFDWLADGTIIR